MFSFLPSLIEASRAAWCGVPLEMKEGTIPIRGTKGLCTRPRCITLITQLMTLEKNGLRISSLVEIWQTHWTRYMKTRAFLRAVAQPPSHVKNKRMPPPTCPSTVFKKKCLFLESPCVVLISYVCLVPYSPLTSPSRWIIRERRFEEDGVVAKRRA
jgi:hypothetical protein